MQAESQVVREGWLIKAPSPKNTWRKFWDTNWKKRYFVLCSGHLPGELRLLWYPDEHHRRSHGKAKSINLQDCDQVDSNLSLSYERRNKRVAYSWIFDIRVNTPKGKVLYYFSAPTEQEMNDWVQLLCRVCHLEREEESDGSGSSFYVANHPRNGQRDRQPSDANANDNRYVETPRASTNTPGSPSRPVQQQNGHAMSATSAAASGRPPAALPPPTQLNIVPPPAFVSRPPAALPTEATSASAPSELSSAASPQEDPVTPSRPADKNLGYIPLKECTSSPTTLTEMVLEAPSRSRLNATSDLDPSSGNLSAIPDFVNADQPPNYPPPPLPTEDGIFQPQQHQFLPPPPPHHSRSPSKDSSASSVHLSSTESEQGENRRPSVGKPFGPGEPGPLGTGIPSGLPSNPTSPVSPPAAVIYNRPPRSSEGSNSLCYLTDDPLTAGTPPPRPPKTSRSSTSSQQKQPFMYENEPSPTKNGDASKFSSYDQLSFKYGRGINFDSLPRTTKNFSGGAANHGRLNSPSAFSTLPKHSTFGEHEKDFANDGSISASPKSFGQEFPSMDHHHKSPVAIARSLHDITDGKSRSRTVSSSSGMTDADSSYSPFTPGPPRLAAPPPSVIRPGRCPSSEMDTAGDQYQNFTHQPRMSNGNHQPLAAHAPPPLPEKPPEVKRDLKPGPRNRGPSLPSTSPGATSGIGVLPKMPTRLPDVKKNSLQNTGSASGIYYSNNAKEKAEETEPQFDVRRQVSFKKDRNNLGRQQTAPALMGASGSAVSTPRTGTLDAEVKIEEEQQLEYVAIDTPATRNTVSPPGTPSMTPRRFVQGAGMHSHPDSPASTLRVGPPPPTAPGYVQIDPAATKGLREVQAAASAMRDSQQRTLENCNRNQKQGLNGVAGMAMRKK